MIRGGGGGGARFACPIVYKTDFLVYTEICRSNWRASETLRSVQSRLAILCIISTFKGQAQQHIMLSSLTPKSKKKLNFNMKQY